LVERVCAKSTSLNGERRSLQVVGLGGRERARGLTVLSHDMGIERELKLTSVTNLDSVGASWRFDDSAERALSTVLDVDAHLVRSVIGTLPQGDVGIKWSALGLQDNMNSLDLGTGKRPSLQRSSLYLDFVRPGGDEFCRASTLTCTHASLGLVRSNRSGKLSLLVKDSLLIGS
jgi:hypothetical protein